MKNLGKLLKANFFKEKEKLSALDKMKSHPEMYWSACLKLFNYQQAKNAITVGGSFASSVNMVKFNGCNWDPFSITLISPN
jgi:hypothetical protein